MSENVYLIRLRFLAPVHFGDAGEGGGLEQIKCFCHADTFFSALCREAAGQGEAAVQRLYGKASAGALLLSDLLPYREISGNYEFYLPRPVLTIEGRTADLQTLREVQQSAEERKKLKKRAFIRASEMSRYLTDMREGTKTISKEPMFGTMANEVHFNGRTRQPYSVGTFHFAENTGAYFLLRLAEEEDLQWFLPLLSLLGLSGIGGRRSSGCGRFEIADGEVDENLADIEKNGDAAVMLDCDYEAFGADDLELARMLADSQSPYQMSLCPVLPQKNEIGVNVTGKFIRRGGFSYSQGMETPVRTGSIYMMDTGSCFASRVSGRIGDVSCGLMPHPVYKYGKGLFVGIK